MDHKFLNRKTPRGPPASKIHYRLSVKRIHFYLLRRQPAFGCNFRDTGFGDQPCLREAKPSQSRVGRKVGSARPCPTAQVGKLVGIFHFQKSHLYYLGKSRVDVMRPHPCAPVLPSWDFGPKSGQKWPTSHQTCWPWPMSQIKCLFTVKWFLKIWIIFLKSLLLHFHIRANAFSPRF